MTVKGFKDYYEAEIRNYKDDDFDPTKIEMRALLTDSNGVFEHRVDICKCLINTEKKVIRLSGAELLKINETKEDQSDVLIKDTRRSYGVRVLTLHSFLTIVRAMDDDFKISIEDFETYGDIVVNRVNVDDEFCNIIAYSESR